MKLDLMKQSQQKRVKYEWRFKQGFNRWRPYPHELNVKIESAYRAELERYHFTMNRYEYEIQFHFLRAVNLETKEYHEIARIENSSKNRTHSMFDQSSSPLVTHNNLNFYAAPKRKKQQIRSATVDLTKDKNGDFDSLIKQQQKAMKYFNKKHSRANSLRHSVGGG